MCKGKKEIRESENRPCKNVPRWNNWTAQINIRRLELATHVALQCVMRAGNVWWAQVRLGDNRAGARRRVRVSLPASYFPGPQPSPALITHWLLAVQMLDDWETCRRKRTWRVWLRMQVFWRQVELFATLPGWKKIAKLLSGLRQFGGQKKSANVASLATKATVTTPGGGSPMLCGELSLKRKVQSCSVGVCSDLGLGVLLGSGVPVIHSSISSYLIATDITHILLNEAQPIRKYAKYCKFIRFIKMIKTKKNTKGKHFCKEPLSPSPIAHFFWLQKSFVTPCRNRRLEIHSISNPSRLKVLPSRL